MDVERFILEYGAWTYIITFVWTFFEGETFVLLAGFAAAQGMLFAPFLLIAAWLGSFAGDQCYFWLGRHFGQRLMERRPEWRPRVDSALSWLKRFDTIFILTFRFIYGVRNFSSFALGISRINWKRFLALNLIAGPTLGRDFHRHWIFMRPGLGTHARPDRPPSQHPAARRLYGARRGRSSLAQNAPPASPGGGSSHAHMSPQ